MTEKPEENGTENVRTIVDAGFRQVSLLESIASSIDQRAGVLIGLLAVATTLAFGADAPSSSSVLDLLFWYSGFGLLFAALATLAASFAPKRRRYGPNMATLYDACLDFDEEATLKAIAKELKETWLHNGPVNEVKATLFKVGLWLSLSGLAVLAIDVLIVRPHTL